MALYTKSTGFGRNPIKQYVLRNIVTVTHEWQVSLPRILVFQIKTSIMLPVVWQLLNMCLINNEIDYTKWSNNWHM